MTNRRTAGSARVLQGKALLLMRGAFFACAAVVLYLALVPVGPPPLTGWDKANHLLAFATLTALGLAGWPQRSRALVVGLFAYGIAIELLQAMTPHRQADWHDVVADGVGVLAVVAAVQVGRRVQQRFASRAG